MRLIDKRKGSTSAETRARGQNDWIASEVATASRRMRGVCSVTSLKASVLVEIERCHGLLGMSRLNSHFGNSGVSLRKPDHAKRMPDVFALANRIRIPIIFYMRSRSGTEYGAGHSRLFVRSCRQSFLKHCDKMRFQPAPSSVLR